MKIEELKIGQTVQVKSHGELIPATVDSFTKDIFEGETFVIVEVLGQLRVVHPKSLK